MDLDRFLNLLATLFGAVGSLYVLKGLVELSPDLIERLSRSYYDFIAPQIASLAAQKADSNDAAFGPAGVAHFCG